MNKSDIIAKLTELGIPFDPKAKKDELAALLPTEAPVQIVGEDQPNSRGAAEEDQGSESVTVYDPKGNAHRTYSASIHGDGFKELAEEYVSRRPGWTAR